MLGPPKGDMNERSRVLNGIKLAIEAMSEVSEHQRKNNDCDNGRIIALTQLLEASELSSFVDEVRSYIEERNKLAATLNEKNYRRITTLG